MRANSKVYYTLQYIWNKTLIIIMIKMKTLLTVPCNLAVQPFYQLNLG